MTGGRFLALAALAVAGGAFMGGVTGCARAAAASPASCAYAGSRMPDGSAIRTDMREQDVCANGAWTAKPARTCRATQPVYAGTQNVGTWQVTLRQGQSVRLPDGDTATCTGNSEDHGLVIS
jgi:hypothetical protein